MQGANGKHHPHTTIFRWPRLIAIGVYERNGYPRLRCAGSEDLQHCRRGVETYVASATPQQETKLPGASTTFQHQVPWTESRQLLHRRDDGHAGPRRQAGALVERPRLSVESSLRASPKALNRTHALRSLRLISSTTSFFGMRTCARVSRSRSVTVPSVSVSPSTVMHHGVPISSWRRYRFPIAPCGE